MLATGDVDMQATLFDAFMSYVPVARAKASIYFSQNSSVVFDEYTSIIGTTHSQSYGCNRAGVTSPPIGYAEDQWNHYNWQGKHAMTTLLDAQIPTDGPLSCA